MKKRFFTTTKPSPVTKQKKLVVEKQESDTKAAKINWRLKKTYQFIWTSIAFLSLVVGFSVKSIVHSIIPPGKKWSKPLSPIRSGTNYLYEKLVSVLDKSQEQTPTRSYLIELSFRNMQAKKTRTFVTVFGMAISIAFIVFLMSVGYGLQNLVTTRVARLEELQQAEVLPGLSDELALNDKVVARLQNMPQVKSVLPLISVVGRISYQDSIADVAVYGTTTKYLTSSAIKPIRGHVFESHDLSHTISENPVTKSQPNGELNRDEQLEHGAVVRNVTFGVAEGSWLRVRSDSSTQGSILGYTRSIDQDNSNGTEVYGDYFTGYDGDDIYDEDEQQLAIWVRATFPLWESKPCTSNNEENENDALTVDVGCEDGQYLPLLDEGGNQKFKEGYVAKLPGQIIVVSQDQGVLGVSTVLAQTSTDSNLPLVNMASNSATFVTDQEKTVVSVAKNSLRQAVVNKAILTLLGLSEEQAVGQSITLTFVAVGELIEGEAQRIESTPTTYEIVGITPEEDTPVVYVPLMELRSLGLNRFSQVKVIASSQNELQSVRSSIEAMGYGTVSVVDTVAQIDNLFGSFRLLLGIIGLVALSVAALGMFNTLTVSLLERTREVGLLKAMGMKTEEVRELFLTESMIMGFYGGVLGLIIGIGLGKLLSIALSSIAIARGVGFVDVSAVPFSFVLVIVLLAIVVGIITGYFPARRATKISALNALRYE